MYNSKREEIMQEIDKLRPEIRKHITEDDIFFLGQYKDVKRGLDNLVEAVEECIYSQREDEFVKGYINNVLKT